MGHGVRCPLSCLLGLPGARLFCLDVNWTVSARRGYISRALWQRRAQTMTCATAAFNPASTPLRFILIHDAIGLRRWQAECVGALTTSGETVLKAVAIDSAPAAPRTFGWWQCLYDRVVTVGMEAFDLVEPSDEIKAVPCLETRTL